MGKIEQVGFIGLGLMGTSMSNNLLKAGFKVKGYDPLPGAGDGIKANGGEIVDTPGATGEGSQLVIVMVPDVPEVDAVLNGDDGLLKSPGEGRVVMVMCTIDPGAVLEFAEQAKSAGWAMSTRRWAGRRTTPATAPRCSWLRVRRRIRPPPCRRSRPWARRSSTAATRVTA